MPCGQMYPCDVPARLSRWWDLMALAPIIFWLLVMFLDWRCTS